MFTSLGINTKFNDKTILLRESKRHTGHAAESSWMLALGVGKGELLPRLGGWGGKEERGGVSPVLIGGREGRVVSLHNKRTHTCLGFDVNTDETVCGMWCSYIVPCIRKVRGRCYPGHWSGFVWHQSRTCRNPSQSSPWRTTTWQHAHFTSTNRNPTTRSKDGR